MNEHTVRVMARLLMEGWRVTISPDGELFTIGAKESRVTHYRVALDSPNISIAARGETVDSAFESALRGSTQGARLWLADQEMHDA